MRTPPPELQKAFTVAALQYGVPATLLAAVAYQESKYDAEAVGPTTAAGWQAKGLMQLSPSVLARYNVSDPFDPIQNVRGAADMLAHLGKGTDWNWARMLASYNWGVGNLVKAEQAGKPLPRSVQRYVDTVIASRHWLQDQVEPVGATTSERLNNAIVGLARANANDPASQKLAAAWTKWWNGPRKVIADYDVLQHPALVVAWRRYADAYDRAPVTDSNTPPPAAIDPSAWQEISEKVDSVLHKPIEAVTEFARDSLSNGVAAGVVVAAVVLWFLAGTRRSGGVSGRFDEE